MKYDIPPLVENLLLLLLLLVLLVWSRLAVQSLCEPPPAPLYTEGIACTGYNVFKNDVYNSTAVLVAR